MTILLSLVCLLVGGALGAWIAIQVVRGRDMEVASAVSPHEKYGYMPPAPRVCGICKEDLPKEILKTHDGKWRCAKHKAL